MANTITIVTNRTATPARQTGFQKLSVATTETYATASNGFTLALATTLSALGINPADVLEIFGYTLNGHKAIFTPTSTAGEYTVRLWDNAGSEISDGAMTETVKCLIWLCPSGVN